MKNKQMEFKTQKTYFIGTDGNTVITKDLVKSSYVYPYTEQVERLAREIKYLDENINKDLRDTDSSYHVYRVKECTCYDCRRSRERLKSKQQPKGHPLTSIFK